ncbi:MAG: leucine-rich repeat protein [Bacteroidaceae bacterium]|nr:leucine-rich repeat protein [Bacteroidaceae bacterium]
MADDVKIDGYAEKIGEIQQGGGGSQFAIDFGEEIYTNNAYTMTAEQEDIDYYNQIQAERAAYAAGTGGRSDAEILADPEFKRKIAWWPKGMDVVLPKRYVNLRTLPKFTPTSCFQGFQYTFHLKDVYNVDFSQAKDFNSAFYYSGIEKLRLKATATNIYSLCYTCVNLKEVYLECNGTANDFGSGFLNCLNLIEAILIIPAVNNISNLFQGCQSLRKVSIENPNLTNVTNAFSGVVNLEEISIDITNIGSIIGWSKMQSLIDGRIKGLKASLTIESQYLTMASVKYILDNCQAREDGAAYTLTLHADVKAAFMAKCTEGDENYDAEYAATLAAANAKGLTIA